MRPSLQTSMNFRFWLFGPPMFRGRWQVWRYARGGSAKKLLPICYAVRAGLVPQLT